MTSDDFIAELERRQLLSDRLMGKLRNLLAGYDEPHTAEELADFLVQKNHLTRDQATSDLGQRYFERRKSLPSQRGRPRRQIPSPAARYLGLAPGLRAASTREPLAIAMKRMSTGWRRSTTTPQLRPKATC